MNLSFEDYNAARAACVIAARHEGEKAFQMEGSDREELLSAALTVATAVEIKQLFLEFQAAGVTFFQALKRQPWGARNFIVKDPDGNLLLFAGPAE